MSVPVMARCFELPATVGPEDRLLLLALASFCDRDGGNAYPSVATLATMTRVSTRPVQRRLRKLERQGLIAKQASARQHRPRTYCLPFAMSGDSGVPSHPSRGGAAVTPLTSPPGVALSQSSHGVFAIQPRRSCDTRSVDPKNKKKSNELHARIVPHSPRCPPPSADTEQRRTTPRPRRRLTKQELEHVKRIRHNRCGCTHEPRCSTYDACLMLIADEWLGPLADRDVDDVAVQAPHRSRSA